MDNAEAHAIVNRLLNALPSGSYLTMSHLTPEIRFLAVSSGFGDQVSVGSAWRVDEGVVVSLAA